MQHILSAEQENVLSQIEGNSTLNIKYIDPVVAVQTLVLICLDKLELGSKINIVCQDQELIQILVDQLEVVGLANLVLETYSNSHISDKSIAALRALAKTKVESSDSSFRHHYAKKFLLHDLNITYSNLLNAVSNDLNISNLPQVVKYKAIKNSNNYVDLQKILIHCSGKSYHQILGQVNELSRIYDPIFETLANSEIFSKTFLSNHKQDYQSDLAMIQKHVDCTDNIYNEFRKIADNYFILHTEANRRISKETITELRQTILSLSNGPSEKQRESGFFDFFTKDKSHNDNGLDKTLKSVIKTLNLNGFLQIAKSERAISDKKELIDFISDCLIKLENFDSSDIQDEGSPIKHLSLLNQDDDDWNTLSVRLTDLLNDINSDGFLKTRYENNSGSLTQQIKLVQTLKSTLSHSLYRLQNYSQYYSYKSKVANDDMLTAIHNNFKTFPSNEWREIFEFNFFKFHLENSLNQVLPNEINTLAEVYLLSKKAWQERIDNLVAFQNESIKTSLSRLKTNNKTLHQKLIKKKLPSSIVSSELKTDHPNISKELFPIHISSEQTSDSYDEIICIGPDHPESDMYQRINFLPFDQNDFNNITEEKDYSPLYLNYYQYSKPLQQLSNTNRIKAAKKLAKLLLAINQSIKIYQLKEANIISLLPFQDDQILESSLLKLGAKNMHLDDVYLQLVESLLVTDRSQFLIIKDGLIDPINYPQLLWQYDVIKKYQSAGICIKSVYTKDQLSTSISEPITYLVEEMVTYDVKNEVLLDNDMPPAIDANATEV